MADEKYRGVGRYQGDGPDPGDALENAVNKATGGAPKPASRPYTHYSPEARSARQQGLRDLVGARNDARERLENQTREFGERNRYRELNTDAKDGERNRYRELNTYARGGAVKHGSSTSVACSINKIVR